MGCAKRDAECLGNGLHRHVQQVMQNDDGAVVDREVPEPTLQLVTVPDGSELV